MFKPEKDERLSRIEHEAMSAAFITYFFGIMGLMITKSFVHAEVLSDPDFLLVVPWLLTILVFVGVMIAKGYYSAVREENTRTAESLRGTRATLITQVVWYAVAMFAINRLNLFSDETASISEDLMDASIFALMMGVATWFFTGRKTRQKKV